MRLPYTANPPQLANSEDQAFLEQLLKSRGSYGLSELDLALFHSPPLTRGFMQFFGAVRFANTLPSDVLELAMCRVGALNEAAFEWMHHAPLLLKAGVGVDGVETVRTAKPGTRGGEGDGGLSARLWKVMRLVDEMTVKVKVEDEVFNAARAMFDDRQMVELVLTISAYNAISRFLVALDVAEMKDTKVGDASLPDGKL